MGSLLKPKALDSRGLRPRARRLGSCIALSYVLSGASPALAQPSSEQNSRGGEQGWIRQWTDRRGDLQSPHLHDRLHAIERLATSKKPEDRRALVDAIRNLASPESPRRTPGASRSESLSPEADVVLRLALARALAGHTGHPEARRALIRLMGAPSNADSAEATWALHTAALALARAGTPDALQALGRALRQGQTRAQAARDALLTYPPEPIEPLLESAPNDPLIELLGELGEPRAGGWLRRALREGPGDRAALAAWSLHQVGDTETQGLARHWWQKSQDPLQKLVAVRILLDTTDPLAIDALGTLLENLPSNPKTARAVLELAAHKPHPRWDGALIRLARNAFKHAAARAPSDAAEALEQRTLILHAIAQLETPQGLDFLAKELDGSQASAVAEALARTQGPQASAWLGDQLTHPGRRLWALRALAVRLAQGAAKNQRGLFEKKARDLLAQRETEDRLRAAAAWALAVAAPEQAAPLFQNPNTAVVHAIARQAFRSPLAEAAVKRLLQLESEAPSDPRRKAPEPAALFHACLEPQAARRIPTPELRRLLSTAAFAAPPLIEALTARTTQPRGFLAVPGSALPQSDVRGWLEHDATPYRAGAARGLARAPASALEGLLGVTLQNDVDPVVRRAAATSLVARPEAAPLVLLEQAAWLDPDPSVRELTQLALAARTGARVGQPLESSNARLATTSLADDPPLLWLVTDHPVELLSALGQSLWLLPDPDGFVGVFGFEAEPWEVRQLPVENAALEGESPEGP